MRTAQQRFQLEINPPFEERSGVEGPAYEAGILRDRLHPTAEELFDFN